MIKWFALFLVLLFVYHVREIFPPFIVGGIIAYLLLPLVNSLSQSAKIKASLAVLIIYLATGAIIFGVAWFLGPLVKDQAINLVSNLHDIVRNWVQQVATTFSWQIDVDSTANDIISSIEQSVGKPDEIVHMGSLLSKSLLSLLVCTVSSIYFIVDSSRVGHFFLRFVPEERHEAIIDLSGQMNIMLSKYVRGQLFLIIIMSFVSWSFLQFGFHLKYAVLIAIMSGFLEIIPVLGPIVAISIATIVGVYQSGIGVAVPLVICYWLARLAEDYLVVPKIIGHAVELHPLAVIFAVLCGEVMAGGLGMLIAIPVAASVKLILDQIYPPQSKIDAEMEELHHRKDKHKPPKDDQQHTGEALSAQPKPVEAKPEAASETIGLAKKESAEKVSKSPSPEAKKD